MGSHARAGGDGTCSRCAPGIPTATLFHRCVVSVVTSRHLIACQERLRVPRRPPYGGSPQGPPWKRRPWRPVPLRTVACLPLTKRNPGASTPGLLASEVSVVRSEECEASANRCVVSNSQTGSLQQVKLLANAINAIRSDLRLVTIPTQWHYFSLGPAVQLDCALPRPTSQLSRTFAWWNTRRQGAAVSVPRASQCTRTWLSDKPSELTWERLS